MYVGPEPGGAAPVSHEADPEAGGTSLCNACLKGQLETDLSAFAGRCLLFEPSLGPDTFTWRPIGDGDDAAGLWTRDQARTARSALDRMNLRCHACGEPGRFLWIPVEHDANLWAGDWLSALSGGALAPAGTLCGRCAAGRLVDSMDARGLCFEAIAPPPGGVPDSRGAMFCAELDGSELDGRDG